MIYRERVKLLFGPYNAPALRKGDRAFCLYRDADVVITSWTDARISWPRCRALDRPIGGSGLLICEEMGRAIRNESAAAIHHWWGVSLWTVSRWGKTFGVQRTEPEGSRRLNQAAAQAGGDAVRGRELTPEGKELHRRIATELKLGRFLQPGYHGPVWTPEQLALLGTMPDAEIAKRIGRTPNATRIMRRRLGIGNAFDGRRRKSRRPGRSPRP
jgi:hypothetical protein